MSNSPFAHGAAGVGHAFAFHCEEEIRRACKRLHHALAVEGIRVHDSDANWISHSGLSVYPCNERATIGHRAFDQPTYVGRLLDREDALL